MILRNIPIVARFPKVFVLFCTLCAYEGCGKTSLLNVLAARVSKAGSNNAELSGSVLVNGKAREDESFRRVSAYVLQVSGGAVQ